MKNDIIYTYSSLDQSFIDQLILTAEGLHWLAYIV